MSTSTAAAPDVIQDLLDKFDSEDEKTKAGAAGVDEDIMAELKRRGHVTRERINPMKLCIHHLNRGSVIGNSMNLDPLIANIVEMSFSWKECEHAICMRLAPHDHESENAYREWCESAPSTCPRLRPAVQGLLLLPAATPTQAYGRFSKGVVQLIRS